MYKYECDLIKFVTVIICITQKNLYNINMNLNHDLNSDDPLPISKTHIMDSCGQVIIRLVMIYIIQISIFDSMTKWKIMVSILYFWFLLEMILHF